MFGWNRRADVRKRADRLRLLVAMLAADLHSMSYEKFVETYRQFAAGFDELDRYRREITFGFKFSPSCWYDAHAELPEGQDPMMSILGGGDDYGVFITVEPAGAGAIVDVHLPSGQWPGRDAKAMVRELSTLPGFRRFGDLTKSLGL